MGAEAGLRTWVSFPFQWEIAPVLDTIWFAEGFGQYAAIMAIAAGMPNPAAYRENILATRFRRNITMALPFLKDCRWSS